MKTGFWGLASLLMLGKNTNATKLCHLEYDMTEEFDNERTFRDRGLNSYVYFNIDSEEGCKLIYDGTPAVPHPFMFIPLSTESSEIAPETFGSKVEFSMDIYTYSSNDCMYDKTLLSSELEDEDLFFIKDGYDISYWDKLSNDGAAGPPGSFCKVVFDFSAPTCYMNGDESTCGEDEEKVIWYTYIDYTNPANWWDNLWGMLVF